LGGWYFVDVLSFFFFQAEDGIRDYKVTGVQTCALPISTARTASGASSIAAGWRWYSFPRRRRVRRCRPRPSRAFPKHAPSRLARSEERRVGKEWRARGGAVNDKKEGRRIEKT